MTGEQITSGISALTGKKNGTIYSTLDLRRAYRKLLGRPPQVAGEMTRANASFWPGPRQHLAMAMDSVEAKHLSRRNYYTKIKSYIHHKPKKIIVDVSRSARMRSRAVKRKLVPR